MAGLCSILGMASLDLLDGLDQGPRTIDIPDGELALWADWLPASAAYQLFERLRTELAWEQSVIRIHGRAVQIPRFNAWYGDEGAGYRYSGTRFEPKPWTTTLANIRQRIEMTTGAKFNSVLANLYRDGSDSVGWHADDEAELGCNPVIASLSLGSERKFSLKHKTRKDMERLDLVLPSGSLLVMRGTTQHFWQHQLPKTVKPVGPRINLTYRQVTLS